MNIWQQLWDIAQPIVVYAILALVVVILTFVAGFLYSLFRLKWQQFKTKNPELSWAIENGAYMAVRAVEQMAKAGGYDSKAKLQEAIKITGQYIDNQVPGVVVNEDVLRAAIESAVYILKQNEDHEKPAIGYHVTD